VKCQCWTVVDPNYCSRKSRKQTFMVQCVIITDLRLMATQQKKEMRMFMRRLALSVRTVITSLLT
jgi:hypothetical protein